MDQVNRVAAAYSFRQIPERSQALFKLEANIRNGSEPSLSSQEIETLLHWLPAESDDPALAALWRLLLTAPADERVKSLALQWVRQTAAPYRGFALEYLRTRYPDQFQPLFETYRNDPDPNVRYTLAQHLQKSDPIGALDMMITALPNASHELWDAIWFELEQSGTMRHLALLRKMDREAGGRTGYATIADSMEARLRNT